MSNHALSQKYAQKLAALPPPGRGCHSALLGVANLGCMCGKTDEEIFLDIRNAIKPGTRSVPSHEIESAISRARLDAGSGNATGEYPLQSRRVEPKPVSLAEVIAGDSRLLDAFKQVVFSSDGNLLDFEKMVTDTTEPSLSSLYEVLTVMFDPTDKIFLGELHSSSPSCIRPVAEWIEILKEQENSLKKLPPETREKKLRDFCKTIPHICLNPFTGGTAPTKTGDKMTYRGDKCIEHFRYFIVESDSLPFAQQEALIFGLERLGFPLVAVVYSGGKSCHAWFKCVGINTLEEWDQTIKNRLFPLLALVGADKACANAARLSRTPCGYRPEKLKFQKTIFLNPSIEEGKMKKTIDVTTDLEKTMETLCFPPVTAAEPVQVFPAEAASDDVSRRTLSSIRLNDQGAWAEYFYACNCTSDGAPMLVNWNNQWFVYEDHCSRATDSSGMKTGPMWRGITDSDLRARIVAFLQEKKFYECTQKTITDQVVNTILCNLNSTRLCNIPSGLPMPCFLKEKKPAEGWLVTQNAAINVAYIAQQAKLQKIPDFGEMVTQLSPNLFCTYSVPYGFDPMAKCPRFLKYLEEVQPDAETREQLQLLAGLLLIPDTHFNVAFFLYGEAGTGKSVFAEVLLSLLGKENCCSVPLPQFADRFRTIDLTTHLANICNDLSMGDCKKMGDVTSIFKAVTSGESLPIEIKYKNPGVAKAIARLVFTTNELPSFSDLSKGVWDRLRIIPFEQRFRANPVCVGDAETEVQSPEGRIQNPYLIEELRTELPGILIWALHGLIKLQRLRSFPESRAGLAVKEDLRKASTPERTFLLETVTACPDGFLPSSLLYTMYKDWSIERGLRVTNRLKLLEALKRVFPGITEGRYRYGNVQNPINGFRGVRFIADAEQSTALLAEKIVHPVAAIVPEAPPLPAALTGTEWLAGMLTTPGNPSDSQSV